MYIIANLCFKKRYILVLRKGKVLYYEVRRTTSKMRTSSSNVVDKRVGGSYGARSLEAAFHGSIPGAARAESTVPPTGPKHQISNHRFPISITLLDRSGFNFIRYLNLRLDRKLVRITRELISREHIICAIHVAMFRSMDTLYEKHIITSCYITFFTVKCVRYLYVSVRFTSR